MKKKSLSAKKTIHKLFLNHLKNKKINKIYKRFEEHLDKNIDQMEIEKIALNVENVKNYISSSKIKKAIYIKDRLINFVI